MKRLVLAAATVLLAYASAASAADMAVKSPRPAVAPVFGWAGFYLGVNAGYGWNDRSGDITCVGPTGIPAGPGCLGDVFGRLKPQGALAGGQVGYNWQSGTIVWGAEADLQWSGIRNSSSFFVPCCLTALANPTAFASTATQDLRWFGTVRGRLGVAIAERGLLYGTAGLIYGEEAVSYALVGSVVSYATSASSTRTGWTAGGGFEYAFTNNLTGKIEGLYYDMGSQRISFTNAATQYTENGAFRYTGALVRGGLNWKFGGPVVAKY
jgi:outer membrane immunogenic protein